MTDVNLKFREMKDEMFGPTQVLPSGVNVFDGRDAFNKASMASSNVTLGLAPQEPQVVDNNWVQEVQTNVSNTINAPATSLPDAALCMQTPQQSDIGALCGGIRDSVFGLIGEAMKSIEDPVPDQAPEFDPKLQMNMAPKPPTTGMGIGGGMS